MLGALGSTSSVACVAPRRALSARSASLRRATSSSAFACARCTRSRSALAASAARSLASARRCTSASLAATRLELLEALLERRLAFAPRGFRLAPLESSTVAAWRAIIADEASTAASRSSTSRCIDAATCCRMAISVRLRSSTEAGRLDEPRRVDDQRYRRRILHGAPRRTASRARPRREDGSSSGDFLLRMFMFWGWWVFWLLPVWCGCGLAVRRRAARLLWCGVFIQRCACGANSGNRSAAPSRHSDAQDNKR